MPINALSLIFLNLFIPFFMSFFSSSKMLLFNYIVAGVLLLVVGLYKRFIKYILGITIFFSIYYFGVIRLNIVEFRIFFSMMLMSIPAFMIASIIISEYNSSHILSNLSVLHLPKPFIVAITVTLRYIPIFFTEFKIIKASFKNRGLDVSLKKPLRYFEYLIVPQLFRSADISKELATAALTKGVRSQKNRSSFFFEGIKVGDCIVVFSYITIAILIASKVL